MLKDQWCCLMRLKDQCWCLMRLKDQCWCLMRLKDQCCCLCFTAVLFYLSDILFYRSFILITGFVLLSVLRLVVNVKIITVL